MIKQLASISLTCIVSILLLAHAIIPHHHHGGIPHFEILHEHHSVDESDDCCSHDKDPNHKTEKHACALEQIIIVSPDNLKDNCPCFTCTQDYPSDLLQAILFSVFYDFSLSRKDLLFLQPPYLISYHTIFVNHSLGLRAPPMA